MPKVDNNSRVYINKKGERVMRVTEVIKVLAKDQLAVWANMLGFKHIDYRKELDRTANIGTLFHEVVSQYTNPRELAIVDFDENKVYGFQSKVEALNTIDSFVKWYQDNKSWYRVVFQEKTIVGDTLGGTIDAGIRGFEDKDKIILVDYKTSGDFYLSMFLQLAGYVRIYEEVYGKNTVEGIMVIRADKKSGHRASAKFMDRTETNLLMVAFESLFNTAIAINYLNRNYHKMGRSIKDPDDIK